METGYIVYPVFFVIYIVFAAGLIEFLSRKIGQRDPDE